MVEHIRYKGGNITKEAGPVDGGTTVTAFVKDPDGYTFALIQKPVVNDPFCQIMLRIGDLDREIKFYEKVTNNPTHFCTGFYELWFNYAVNQLWFINWSYVLNLILHTGFGLEGGEEGW